MYPKHEMTEEGLHNEQVLHLISDLFRVIIKPVDAFSKEDLAPGELGIDCNEWCIWYRDPYTNELITPNSIAHLRTILSKYNEATNELNADLIGNVRIYTNVQQLPQLDGIILSVDSIIRQMEYPSILISYMQPDSPSIVNIPSASGILTVIKLTEGHVSVRYMDSATNSTYVGMYDSEQRLFKGWLSEFGAGSVSDGDVEIVDGNLQIYTNEAVKDLTLLTIRVPETIQPGANISVNRMPLCPIVNMDHTPLATEIPMNSIIMLIRDEISDCWIYTSSSETSTSVLLNIMTNRITTYDTKIQTLSDDIDTLKDKISNMSTNLDVRTFDYVQTGDIPDPFSVPIDNFDAAVDLIIVNMNQTILREGIDYVKDTEIKGIRFTGVTYRSGTTLHCTIIKQSVTGS